MFGSELLTYSNPVGGRTSTAPNLYHVLTTDSTSGLWQQKQEKKGSADIVNTSFELYRSNMQ